jgi:hypothetical protein
MSPLGTVSVSGVKVRAPEVEDTETTCTFTPLEIWAEIELVDRFVLLGVEEH